MGDGGKNVKWEVRMGNGDPEKKSVWYIDKLQRV